jgi:hypothetical protein
MAVDEREVDLVVSFVTHGAEATLWRVRAHGGFCWRGGVNSSRSAFGTVPLSTARRLIIT